MPLQNEVHALCHWVGSSRSTTVGEAGVLLFRMGGSGDDLLDHAGLQHTGEALVQPLE